MAVASSRAENTCNALLCEELRKLELEAWFEEHFLTKFGTSKPDIHITFKGQNYFVEAKQRPHKLVDAVSKAYTYQKRLGAFSPKAVFAAVYSEDCMGECEMAALLNQPPFYVRHTAGSLQDLAKSIQQMVVEPPIAIELSTKDAIRLLREAVLRISAAFTKLGPKDVEGIFGGRVFFETVLGIKEEMEIPIRYLRDAASYLLVNQILFYQILAKEKAGPIRYEEVDSEKLREPKELQERYFSRVLLKDYRPIFGFDVASKVKGLEAVDAIKVTIDSVNALSPESLGHDVLGKIFHNLIPLELRKSIAAFYTNIQAGEILAGLAIDKPDSLVLDPACGSGTLLVSSYQRKKALLEEGTGRFDFEYHRRFVEEQMTGVDIMPFAAHLAAVHLSLQAPLYTTDFVRVAIKDSTGLNPGDTITAAQEVLKETFKQRRITEDFTKPIEARHRTVSGVVQLTGQGNERPIQLSKVDIVIMNPPFTRFQRIPPWYKRELRKRFGEPKYEKCLRGNLGLHGYFALLADKFLRPGGRIAAVLPVTTLNARGFYPIIQQWLTDYCIEYVIVGAGRSAFSENTQLREMLFIARKHKPAGNRVAVAVLKKSPDSISVDEAHLIAKDLKKRREKADSSAALVDDEHFLLRFVDQADLKGDRALFRLVTSFRPELMGVQSRLSELLAHNDKAISFGDYLDETHGDLRESPYRRLSKIGYFGFAVLNSEERALKKHDVWVVSTKEANQVTVRNRFTNHTFDIPVKALAPSLRRMAGLRVMDVTDVSDYVVVKPFKGFESFLNMALREKEAGKAMATVKGSKWTEFVEGASSRLLMLYRGDITSRGTHFLAFAAENPIFAGGDFWICDVPDKDIKILAIWINSSVNTLSIVLNRKETRGGWIRFDEYILRDTDILDPRRLDTNERKEIEEIYDTVSGTEFPDLLTQLRERNPDRMKIDKAVLKCLGMPVDEIDSFLEELYVSLVLEIEGLAKMMAGD